MPFAWMQRAWQSQGWVVLLGCHGLPRMQAGPVTHTWCVRRGSGLWALGGSDSCVPQATERADSRERTLCACTEQALGHTRVCGGMAGHV